MKQAILTLTYGGFAFTIDSNHLPKKSVSVFLRAAIPEIEKMLNADATCMDVDPIDHDNQMREEGAKAERERILNELSQMYANVPEQFLEGTYRLHSEWKEKIESLRHGQERSP